MQESNIERSNAKNENTLLRVLNFLPIKAVFSSHPITNNLRVTEVLGAAYEAKAARDNYIRTIQAAVLVSVMTLVVGTFGWAISQTAKEKGFTLFDSAILFAVTGIGLKFIADNGKAGWNFYQEARRETGKYAWKKLLGRHVEI